MAGSPPEELAYEESRAQDSRQSAVYGVSSAFYIIAVGTVLIRLLSRKLLNCRLTSEDYLIACALVTSVPFTAATLSAAKYGVGRHVITLTPNDSIEGAKWNVVNVFTYGATMTLIKLSILALYSRVFGPTHPKFRFVLVLLAAYTLLWVLGLYLGYGLSCQPFWRYWSLTESCQSSKTYAYSGAIFDTVGDLLIFAAPQPLIWKLQMPVRRQLAVGGVFCVGLIATVMATVKAIYAGGAPNVAHPIDASWNGVTALIANALEVYLAMTCACLPALPGLVSWIRTQGFSNLASVLGPMGNALRGSPGSRRATRQEPTVLQQGEPRNIQKGNDRLCVDRESPGAPSNTRAVDDIEMQRYPAASV